MSPCRHLLAWLAFAIAAALVACGGGGGGPEAPADALGEALADIPYIKETLPPPEDEGRMNHPPVLARIGDRVVAVGETLTIQVEASDPDGDPLTFSVYGDIPEGAKFDKNAHVFTWVPLQAGKVVYLTFVASDGQDMDRETVEIRVAEGKTGHPPVFEKVSDQVVQPGIPATVALKAQDPDGDPLEYGVVGQPPPQSQVDAKAGVFTWTPPKSLEGQIVPVAFVVSDGTYKDRMDVQFVVGEVPGAHPPVLDPLPDQKVAVGSEARFTVRAKDPDGQAVVIALEAGKPDGASFDPATGEFRWTPGPQDGGRTVALRFSATDGQFHVYLVVKVHVESSTQKPPCEDDPFEPNNEPSQAKDLGSGAYDLSICDTDLSPVDSDWFRITLKPGETLMVRLEFEHDLGDIDMDVSVDGSTDSIVAFSNGTGDEEEIEFKATSGGQYLLAIYGVADTKYSNTYHMTLTIEATATCPDDSYEENDSLAKATPLPGEYGKWTGLAACPGDEDWFSVVLKAGDGVLAAATPENEPISLRLVGPDGKTVLDSDGPKAAPLAVAAQPVQEAGMHYLVVTSVGGARYTLEFLVESAQAGCTSKSCPAGQVCDKASGKCVSDYCEVASDCPAGLPCIQTYCVEPCQEPWDCRDGYTCKALLEGTYCGEKGSGQTGAACHYFSECAGPRGCLFEDKGGYCAVAGCASDWDCPLDAWCITHSGFFWCAAECSKPTDCRETAGFQCRAATSVDGAEVSLCLP